MGAEGFVPVETTLAFMPYNHVLNGQLQLPQIELHMATLHNSLDNHTFAWL